MEGSGGTTNGPANAGARIGAVHIIESLSTGEAQTGWQLFDELQPLGFTLRPHIETLFSREPTRAGFLARVAAVFNHLRQTGRAPIIHLEAHGLLDPPRAARGLYLASGEVVTWADLKPLLTEINLACSINLLLVSGACDGAAFAQVIVPSDRAPVFAVLGPTRVVTAGELFDGHLAFYRNLYRTRDLSPAISAANDAVPKGDRPFVLFGAEWFFREVLRGYFRRYCTQEAIDARVAKAAPLEAALRADGALEEEIVARRNEFRRYLTDHRMHFEKFKPHFFAEDLFPANADRFNVAYDDCVPPAPEQVQ